MLPDHGEWLPHMKEQCTSEFGHTNNLKAITKDKNFDSIEMFSASLCQYALYLQSTDPANSKKNFYEIFNIFNESYGEVENGHISAIGSFRTAEFLEYALCQALQRSISDLDLPTLEPPSVWSRDPPDIVRVEFLTPFNGKLDGLRSVMYELYHHRHCSQLCLPLVHRMQCAGSPMVSLEQLMGGGQRGCITTLNAADTNSCKQLRRKNATASSVVINAPSWTTSCDMSHCPPCWSYFGSVRAGMCTSEMESMCTSEMESMCTSEMEGMCTSEMESMCTSEMERMCTSEMESMCTSEMEGMCASETQHPETTV
jgi:hypothetical protein